MISVFLEWFHARKWAVELVLVALVVIVLVSSVGYWHHETLHKGIAEGIAKQQTADDKVTQELLEAARQQTVEAQTRADKAEHAHDQELADLRAYQLAHPPRSVRLCLESDPHTGQGGVQGGASIDPSHEGTSPATENLREVPTRDLGLRSEEGPDIGGLLELIALRADQLSAQLREFQAR